MSDFNYFSKFSSVPAYSIPKSSRKDNLQNIPGPGQYDQSVDVNHQGGVIMRQD